jgi:hypothetical protein
LIECYGGVFFLRGLRALACANGERCGSHNLPTSRARRFRIPWLEEGGAVRKVLWLYPSFLFFFSFSSFGGVDCVCPRRTSLPADLAPTRTHRVPRGRRVPWPVEERAGAGRVVVPHFFYCVADYFCCCGLLLCCALLGARTALFSGWTGRRAFEVIAMAWRRGFITISVATDEHAVGSDCV